MAIATTRRREIGQHRGAPGPPARRRRWPLLVPIGVVLLALAGAAVAVFELSGATLAPDPSALARVEAQTFAGSVVSARAFGSGGRAIPLAVDGARLTPRTALAPGELVSVRVVVRRPGWSAWLLGRERRESLDVRAPVARVSDRWLTVGPGGALRVTLDQAVRKVAYGPAGRLVTRSLAAPRRVVTLPRAGEAGTIQVAAAARAWERVGAPQQVAWFPAARAPVAVASPAAGTRISPATPLRLTFSRPVSDAVGSATPTLAPKTAGRWSRPDSHTLLFTPSGAGAGLGTHLSVTLPRAVAIAAPGQALRTTRTVGWTVPPGSMMRLQQVLAGLGYLPLSWQPAGAQVARTPAAEVQAAVNAPAGSFAWRYSNTPDALRHLWAAGSANAIMRGAVMAFENRHGIAADGFAGPQVWKALIADAIAGRRQTAGYSYVYVHRDLLPQSATLWSAGKTIIQSAANTGVPGAPTQLGTFPVFEHIASGTMTGTNPDGTHYNDPGIKWISYFNGGDALHAFNRASFGTPQSVGCVELPLASAARIWPYTPIGTLVTIEH